jgi:pyrroline-5-carboxylate reductase
MVDSRKVAVLGAGRIGEALISGLLSAGWREPFEVAATTRRAERVAELRERHGVEATLSNHDAATGAMLVVIAVKPQDIEALLDEIGASLDERQTVLSVAAAIPTARIEARLSADVPVVRAMPNTPALVGEGAAAIAAGTHAGDDDLAWAESILGAVGTVVRVAEGLLDAVTGLSGSGPAYVFVVLDALIEGGVAAGLPRDVAETLAGQTILGAATLYLSGDQSPGELRAAVTSPGGTTAAGLRVLEQRAVRAALIDAVLAARDRSAELGA